MTTYATMRQLQREGSKLINNLSGKEELIITSRGQKKAKVSLISRPKSSVKQKTNSLKFAGAYTGVKHNLTKLDNDWD